MNYWKECIQEAFDEAGIKASEEQMALVAETVEGAHENYGMAFGHDAIPNPLLAEISELNQKLNKEIQKRVCPDCKGKGIDVISFGTRCAVSECPKCRGEGKC